ncbi:PAS domain-containing hybrid sensor histidine kinase/response regulator [Bacteroides fragilis]|jgi:CheY-like chemotaxis protein/two-component sensor histidine kinase|uniref:PAS domain-containing hybrid sensor histidine kinase/response regulator n=1 Tax=Bacteroides fragilis TaxID=817 RepID=UPI00202F1731|nr:PAS domain-containing hybrid sensor histidine kinase/response regulator [Bacteroides fragilis]MCM0248443.1 response regulator [Bacteroides fragilis]MCM0256527.1 response regulator [Bacteroides fragilis]
MSNLPPFLFPAVLCAVFILSVFLILVVRCRRRTARALRQSQEILNLERLQTDTIFGDLPVGIEVYSKEGILVWMNERTCQTFGVVDKRAVIGSTPIMDNPVIPDAVKKAFQRQRKIQVDFDYDFSIICRTGFYNTRCTSEVKRISCKGTPVFGPDGKMQNYVFIMNDISREYEYSVKLKESTQLAYQAIQASGLVHWRYDNRVHRFSSYNDPVTNFDSSVWLTPEDYLGTVHPDDRPGIMDYLRRMDDGADFSDEAPMRVKTAYDDEWQDCVVTGTSYLKDDETGKVLLYTGFRRNVTSWKKMVNELSDAKERAERSDKLKSAFLANISHEIRTPLNAIIGFSNLLTNTDKKEEIAEYQRIIVTNSDLLLRLINDILDLSKIEAGFMDRKLSEFDLSAYFDELYGSVRQAMANPSVELICDNPYEYCLVRMDANRLAQLVLNYATNAIKCTYRGEIRMGYRRQGEGIYFYVSDTGIGIPDKDKSRLYHRFEKLNEFTQGTGLGLAICKVVTESAGGQVGFESEEGVGSTFWSWVPCEIMRVCGEAEAGGQEAAQLDAGLDNGLDAGEGTENLSASTDEPSPADPDSEPSSGGHTDKKTILVVEDIESNYHLMSVLLGNLGYRFTRAADGVEAVEKVLSEHFDLVLMDIKMPRLGGLEATREIRKTNREVPIIALTAHAFNSDKEAAIAAGCNGFLVKPIDRNALAGTLRRFL